MGCVNCCPRKISDIGLISFSRNPHYKVMKALIRKRNPEAKDKVTSKHFKTNSIYSRNENTNKQFIEQRVPIRVHANGVLKNDSKLADEVLPYYANGRLPSKVGGESEVARETSSFSITGFQKKLEELQTKQKNFETEREELRKIGAASKSLAEPAGIVYHGKPLLIRKESAAMRRVSICKSQQSITIISSNKENQQKQDYNRSRESSLIFVAREVKVVWKQ